MAELGLLTCSRQADELCLVYCKVHATMFLDCSDAVLVHLVSKAQKHHIVWMDPVAAQNGIESYIRAFYEFTEDNEDDLSDAVSKHIIETDKDIFCHNGNAYFLHAAPNGNSSIRMLKMFPTQSAVESLERASETEPEVPVNVFLVKFSIIENNTLKYALTCWGVSYEQGCNYISVFDEDSHWLQEYLLEAFVREELPVGTVFKKNNMYYKLNCDGEGKLYLERSPSVFTFNKPKLSANAAPARIIPLYRQSDGT
ncbi:MAG: hypothetical protein J6Y91_00475 [Alphaproteobacteria bacterium]|nr:hypothetical protein [Alphaproteobacteria bacterium]